MAGFGFEMLLVMGRHTNLRSLNLASTHSDLNRLFRKHIHCIGAGIITVCTDAELNTGRDKQERRDTPQEHSK